MFLTAGIDLKFYNWPAEGTEELIYQPHGLSNIIGVSWSKNNVFVTVVSEKSNPEIISLKDPNNIKIVHTISATSDTSAIAFQNTTKRCIGLATNSGQVALYDTKSKSISKLFKTAPCAVNLLEFNAEDKQMAVSCVNGIISLYDVKQGDVCETYTASNSCSPTVMQYHPTEKHILAIALEDGTITQWDTNSGLTRFCSQIHTAPVNGLGLLPNSDLMVSVGYDHKFCIHDLNRECIFRSNQQHPLTAVDVSPDGLTVAVGSEMGNLYIYDIRKLIQPLKAWKAHNTRINKILFEHKIKCDSTESISETPSGVCQKNKEIIANPENKFVKKNLDKIERKCETKVLCPTKCMSKKELKSIPDKCVLEKCIPDKKTQSKTITMNSIKYELADSFHRGANELATHLMAQFGSLHNFITNEFHTIDNQIDEKWDLLNMARDASMELHNKE